MEQAKGKARVYLSEWAPSITEIVKSNNEGGSDGFALGRFYYTNVDLSGEENYVLVGEAEITINFLPEKEITTKQVQSLQEQLRKHRVESQKVENHIRDQISKLLAITDGTVIDQ